MAGFNVTEEKDRRSILAESCGLKILIQTARQDQVYPLRQSPSDRTVSRGKNVRGSPTVEYCKGLIQTVTLERLVFSFRRSRQIYPRFQYHDLPKPPTSHARVLPEIV